MALMALSTAVFRGTPPGTTSAASPPRTSTDPCAFDNSNSPSSMMKLVLPPALTRMTNCDVAPSRQ